MMTKQKGVYLTYAVPLLVEFTSQFIVTFWGSMSMKPYRDEQDTENNTNSPSHVGCSSDDEYLLQVFMPAFQTGLSVWMMITVFWKISGAHFNPAVSMGFLVAGVLKPIMYVPYVISQCLGSIAAALVAKTILGENPGIIAIPDHASTGQVFLNEFMATALLIFCILPTCTNPEYQQQTNILAIGLSVFQGILSAKWVGVVGISPSRVIGPAVVVGGKAWNRHWLFWVADISGGAFAGVYYMLLFAPPNQCWMNRLRIKSGKNEKKCENHELGSIIHDREDKRADDVIADDVTT